IALSQRDVEDGLRGGSERAAAEAQRLGERYRDGVRAQAVRWTVRETELDREQRALLHPLKQTGRYPLDAPPQSWEERPGSSLGGGKPMEPCCEENGSTVRPSLSRG